MAMKKRQVAYVLSGPDGVDIAGDSHISEELKALADKVGGTIVELGIGTGAVAYAAAAVHESAEPAAPKVSAAKQPAKRPARKSKSSKASK